MLIPGGDFLQYLIYEFCGLKGKINISILTVFVACVLSLVSCGGDSKHADWIIINELMPSNRTGIQKNGYDPADWIEIKNTGTDSVNLKGFKLVVRKTPSKNVTRSNEDDAGEDKDEKNVKEKKWSFPSVKIGGGECMVVFADKGNDSESGDFLQADLKLPKGEATVQLLAPNGKVLSEVKYGEMEPDQSLALQPDSTFRATYWQSPGHENTRQGYEAANREILAQRKSPLLIWELMSRAPHSYENWVELKNVGDRPVDLSAYRLSKKMGADEGWPLPAKTLAPGEIISFQLAGGKADKGNGGVKAPFKIGDAETVVLSKDGRFVDGMCAKLTPYGGSIGRRSGAKGLFFFSQPTRDAENSQEGYAFIADKPEWDQKAGVYKGKGKIVLKLYDKRRKVRYTLNGSEPTMSSPVFEDSIVLTKPTVVRSFAEGDSATMRSNIATSSYLIGVDHELPVVNISINSADMFGYNTGIYANGPGYGDEFPFMGANFWKNWTKKAYVELFESGKEGFASDCGLKIFGGFSRALSKKSLRIKFRGEFGDAKVNYDFFDTGQPLDMEDLVLRSGSQDWTKYMIRDEFFTSLAQSGSPTLLTQMYRPVAVYVNAEYFGLYYLREKIDKNFVARKLNLPNDSIDIFLSGPSPYKELEARISKLDMSKKENFELAEKNIDLQGLIDYKIGNIFSGKWDTGNIRYARSRHPDSDRRWRFIYYDIDASWGSDGKPSTAFSLSISPDVVSEEKVRYNILINSLLRNKEFRRMFLERLSYHLANTYSAKNTTAHFDQLIAKIRPEMKRNCERWPQLKYQQWEKNIESFRSRLENRPKIILNDLRDYLHITPEENSKYFSKLGY